MAIVSLNIPDSFQSFIISALKNIAGNRHWGLVKYSDDRGWQINWDDENEDPPLDLEVVMEEARRQEQIWIDAEYSRLRATEYPPLTEFIDAYYWAQKGDNTLMDAYTAKCDAVKAKYPKPINN